MAMIQGRVARGGTTRARISGRSRFVQAVACAGLAGVSILAVPTVAHAADPTINCYSSCTPPTVDGSTVGTLGPADPGGTTDPTNQSPAVNGSSSLPFTGADVVELAAIGLGAVAVGGVLARRKRTTV